jgi:hypothetical protein
MIGKLASPYTKTVAITMVADDGAHLYLNDKEILMTKWQDGLKGVSFDFIKDSMYDFRLDHFEKDNDANLKLYWDMEGKKNLITPQYFWQLKESSIIHYVEVKCREGYYKNSEGVCAECDFRCLECYGEGVENCISCDIEKEAITNSSPPCKCDEGMQLQLPIKLVSVVLSHKNRMR